ncbi:MAG: transporter substrate-binding domain-containing protein, partial [Myxococcota bacterium]
MTGRTKWFGTLLALAVSALSTASIPMTPGYAEAPPRWRVGVLAEDLPFSRVSSNDGLPVSQGLYIDWWRSIGKAAGHAIDFVPCADHETCLHRLKEGEVNFVGPAPFIFDDSVVHTRPVNRRYTFALSTSQNPVRTPLDLEGAKLGLIADARRERAEVASWTPASIEILSTAEARRRLATGTLDAVVADHFLAADLLRNEDRQALWFRWQHIYARTAHQASLHRVDRALDELEPSSARIDGADLSVGADALLLPRDARPHVERDVLAFIADHPTVRLGASAWAPLTVYENERFDGLALRIVQHHLKRAGLTPVYVGDADWPAVRKRAQAGIYDGIGYILVRSENQLDPLIFTEPMIDVPMVVIARSDADFWAKLDDLDGKRLVGNLDYGELATLSSGGRIKRLVEASSPPHALQMVRSGEVDAWLEYLPIARSFIETAGATDVKLAFRMGGPRGARTALQPEWAPVIPLIDASIRQTTREDLAGIYERWNARLHTTSAHHGFDALILPLSVLFAGAIIVLAYRLWREHRTVRRRERSLRRAQRLTATGSVELRAPFDKVDLEGETSSILGISPSIEVQGIDAHIALFKNGEDIREGISKAQTAEVPVRFDVHTDGSSPQVFAYELSPLQLIDGQEVMVGTIRNVTNERARLAHERALKQQVLHLQKQDALGRLAGGFAPDFNTMLAASIGYTELAMREL